MVMTIFPRLLHAFLGTSFGPNRLNRNLASVGRERKLVAVLLVMPLIVLTGCGSGSPSKSTSASGGTFTFGYPRDVTRLDPQQSKSGFDNTGLFPAYDRLVHLSPDGKFIPGLAESWKFSEDATTLTLKIRSDVTFHDGAKLDATAVKTSLDRAKSMKGSSVATDLSSVASVTVVDEMTINLALNRPDVSLLGPLSDRAGIIISPKAIASGVDLDQTMVGAGPYEFVSHTPGSSLVFKRNPNYWDKKNMPKVDKLVISVLPNDVSRMNALKTGELTAAQISANQVDQVKGSGVNVVSGTEFQFVQLIQNRSRGQLGNLKVRQAMVQAIDRAGICKALYAGRCQVSDQPFPPKYFAFNKDIDKVLYPYDPNAAKALLKEAGVGDLQVGMIYPADQAPLPQVAEAMKDQLAKVGITLNLQPTDPSQVADVMFSQKAADMALSSAGGRPDPSQYLYARMTSTAFGNPGGQVSPTIEGLITKSLSETDLAARTKTLQQASAESAKSLLEVVILFPEISYGVRDGAQFKPYITGKPEFRTVSVS